jgi:hypothetical protein
MKCPTKRESRLAAASQPRICDPGKVVIICRLSG